MTRSALPRLRDLLQAIPWIEADAQGYDFEQFANDRRLRQLVERNIEIISEASRHVPEDLKGRYPSIPWRKIAGVGNVLRHEYDRVAPKILWDAIQHDLPGLKRAIETVILELERE
jgi:uncharacterized protein with HEPN domain